MSLSSPVFNPPNAVMEKLILVYPSNKFPWGKEEKKAMQLRG